MPSYMNIISCNTANSNTGVPQCSFDFGLIEQVILVPKDTKFTQTEIQTLYTKLSGMALGSAYAYPYTAAGSEASRAYPIGKFIGIEEKSSETSINTTSFGSITLGKKGQFHYVWEYKNGGMNYDIMLNTFENAQGAYDCLLLDRSSNAVIGTKPDSNSSGYVLQGLSLDLIYCPLPKMANGTDATKHYIGLAFSDANELLRNMAYYELPPTQKVGNIRGLRNIELSVHTAISGGVVKYRVTTDGGAVDLYDTYGGALATLAASWSATNESAGTTPTLAIAATAATKTLNVTYSVNVPTSGQIVTLNTPTIAQMAATVPGFGNASFVHTV